jgi:hypothetical protein
LSACSKHVASPALTDERIDPGLAERGLKSEDIAITRSAKAVSGKFIERDQIHFALNVPQ